MAQIHELTMIELAAAIRAGELSPVAVTDHYLRRAQEPTDQAGAFYTVTAERAADQALAAEKAVTTADEVGAREGSGTPDPSRLWEASPTGCRRHYSRTGPDSWSSSCWATGGFAEEQAPWTRAATISRLSWYVP